MDIAIHNLIEGHAREDLKLLSREGILCSRQRKVRVILNAGQMRGGFLFPFIGHTLPLREWGNFFHQGSQGSYPRQFSDRGRGSDRDLFLHNTHYPLLEVRKGLILLGPHLCVHPLVKFHRHLYEKRKKKKEKKIRVKKKKKKKRKSCLNAYLIAITWQLLSCLNALSKSLIVLAYSIAALTRCLYLLLSFSHFLTVHKTTNRRVSSAKICTKE